MRPTQFILSCSSTTLRALSYIFLRVIPHPFLKIAVPLLYATYASLFLFTAPYVSQPVAHGSVASQDTKKRENGTRNDEPQPGPFVRVFGCALACILSLPSPSVKIRKISFAVNTALLLFVLDFITHPIRHPAHDTVFARIGAVDHNSAKVSVRYPQPESDDSFEVKVVFRALVTGSVRQAEWIEGPTIEVIRDSDWIGSAVISNLWPSTAYQYKLISAVSGTDLPYPPIPLQFRTFPDPRLVTGSHFKFITTSCILPNFPYVPGKGDRIKGFDLMAEYLSGRDDRSIVPVSSRETNVAVSDDASSIFGETAATQFLLLLGDFIYADVPVYFGDHEEAYRRLYRRTYASASFRKIYENLPILHIYDDHEFVNNFAGMANDSTRPFPHASDAFHLYNAQANYEKYEGRYYYHFRYGDVAFFVLDTRRYRSSVLDADADYPTMLGAEQLQDLQAWLAEVNETSSFKFIVSSVPFTTLWQHDAQIDSWAAFKHERSILLESLHTVPNVFILTGDRHEFAAIEFNGPFDRSHTIYEFSTSPLNMFYIPFIRTLNMESSVYVNRTHRHSQDNEEGTQSVIEETRLIPEERVIKYLSAGNHKWSSFEIDTRDPSKPVIQVEVIIDGTLAHSWSLVGQPATSKRSSALGFLLPQSLHDVLNRFGLGHRDIL